MPSADTPQIIRMASVSSTMDELDRLIGQGAPAWTVVMADQQTHGRGRRDRTWIAAAGSALLCSTLLTPQIAPDRLGLVAIAAGVALAEALETWGARATLKWPNDVLISDKKVAGILARSRVSDTGIVVNLGVGVNLTAVPRTLAPVASFLDDEIPNAPTSEQLLRSLLPRLAHWLDRWDGEELRSGWNQRAAYLGQVVSVEEHESVVTGRLLGLGPSGELHLEDADGRLLPMHAGELTRGPRPVEATSPPIL